MKSAAIDRRGLCPVFSRPVTSGNAALASNDATSQVLGTAVGADYSVSAYTPAGFALAGGGANFIANGLGPGRSGLFQAGAYVHHTEGPAYVSAAQASGSALTRASIEMKCRTGHVDVRREHLRMKFRSRF